MRVLENEQIKVKISDVGAELSSVYDKESGQERIWTADPAVWNRHAPILFPFVGKVNGGEYRIGEKTYEMKTQHGFARDMEFECVEQSQTSVTHRLLPTENTKRIYPYDFELLVTHRLDVSESRRLQVIWEVINRGTEEMYYSIGGHPGFTVPEEKEWYYLEFPGREALTYIGVNPENGLADVKNKKTLELKDGLVKFCEDVYDTLIFDEQNIAQVRIVRPNGTPYVTMDCRVFPYLGIWAKKTGNFICLEPWAGRTDDDGFCGSLEEKTGEQRLAPGAGTVISYTIEFHR